MRGPSAGGIGRGRLGQRHHGSEAGQEMHVESYKNSVKLPCLDGRKTLIGARSMSETKQIAFFESLSDDGLSGFRHGRRD